VGAEELLPNPVDAIRRLMAGKVGVAVGALWQRALVLYDNIRLL